MNVTTMFNRILNKIETLMTSVESSIKIVIEFFSKSHSFCPTLNLHMPIIIMILYDSNNRITNDLLDRLQLLS